MRKRGNAPNAASVIRLHERGVANERARRTTLRYTRDGWESNGIDWSTFRQNMEIAKHYTPLDAPEWALNNKKLAIVLKEKNRRHVNGISREEQQHFRNPLNRAAARKAGGYLPMIAGIAYRRWCLGFDSPVIAEEMKMTAVHVRLILYQLSCIAKQLAARQWVPFGKYKEGVICYYCRRRHVDTSRNKWRCTACLEWENARARAYRRRCRTRHAAAA